MNYSYWVSGRPATFATNQETYWKEKIRNGIGSSININNSIELHFQITKDNMNKYAFDVDNLCEPILAVITAQIGWYKGKRENIQCWKASKNVNEIEGVWIKDVDGIEINHECLVFDEVYQGKFPNKATDVEIPLWLQKFSGTSDIIDTCAVSLKFGSKKLSIATISSGKVKPIIDCLYPILGGECGAPFDHKIIELHVKKAVEGLLEDQVRISIWRL